MVGAGHPLGPGLLKEVEGRSHALGDVQGAPGPAHLDVVVRSVGVHGPALLPEPVVLALDRGALFGAPGPGHRYGVQEAGDPGVDLCLVIGDRPHRDLAAPILGRAVGAGGHDRVLLSS